jgi:hypothetical protein
MRHCLFLAAFAMSPVVAQTVDFEAYAIGSAPSGWIASMTNEGGPSRWSVIEDDSAHSGSRLLAQLSDDRTSGRFPLAILDDVSIADGTLRVAFRPISGRVDRAAGLVWRYQDEDNYYVVRANALENNVVLYKVEGGRRTSLSPVGREGDYGVKHTVPSNEWSILGVRFAGPSFVVSIDGEVLHEVRDTSFAAPGRVGLWTKADSVTHFDDFEVSFD